MFHKQVIIERSENPKSLIMERIELMAISISNLRMYKAFFALKHSNKVKEIEIDKKPPIKRGFYGNY